MNCTGQYLMTEETLDFAKKEAEHEAQLKISEEVCTYVKMHATMIDNELNDDEVITTGAAVENVMLKRFLRLRLTASRKKSRHTHRCPTRISRLVT